MTDSFRTFILIAALLFSLSVLSVSRAQYGNASIANLQSQMDGIAASTQRTSVITDSSGNWAVTWNRSFISSTPIIDTMVLNPSGSTPMTCNILSRNQTGVTGKCWQDVTQAVPLISLTVSLTPAAAPTATTIMITGSEPTQ